MLWEKPSEECLTRGQKDKVTKKRHSARAQAKVPQEGKAWLAKEDPVSCVIPVQKALLSGGHRGCWKAGEQELGATELRAECIGVPCPGYGSHTYASKAVPPTADEHADSQTLAPQTQLHSHEE